MEIFYTLFWYIVANDNEKGVGFGVPYRGEFAEFKYRQYHQPTLGLDGVE